MHLKREFARYVLPTMMTYALMAIHVIVDSLFVASAVGDVGIVAVSSVNPIYTIIGALGTGIGGAGSVVASI